MPFFPKNQLVWAKVKGYPWWPAIVAQSNQTRNGQIEEKVLVNFIGEDSHATLAMDKVVDFKEGLESHSVTKNQKLIESIKIAKRISDKESTYEEEKSKLQKKRQRDESDESSPERTPRKKVDKPKNEEQTKKKRINPKEKKKKEKESQMAKDLQNLEDLQGQRFTRSRSKKENVEMLTEPLLFRSKKDSGKGYIKRTKSKITMNKVTTRSGSQKSPSKVTTRASMKKSVEKVAGKPSGRRMSLRRKGNKDEEIESEDDDKENEEDEKSDDEDFEEKKVTKKKKGKRGNQSKKGADSKNSGIDKTKNVDRDMELEEMLQDVDDNEEYGSFEMMEDSMDVKEYSKTRSKTQKRSLSTRENEIRPPRYVSTKDSKSILSDDEETIVKKLKLNNSGGEKMQPNSSTKTRLGYNSFRIKQIEANLDQALRKLSTKFLQRTKLHENDEEFNKLSDTLKEIDSNTFNGGDFLHSDVGKILKTLQFLFEKNRNLVSKQDETVVDQLDSTLQKFQNKILHFCLDNTEYMQSLNLDEENKTTSQEQDDSKMQIEDPDFDRNYSMPALNLEENSMFSMRLEDDEQSRQQGTPLKTANSFSLHKEDSTITNPNDGENKSIQNQGKLEQAQKPKDQATKHHERRKKICLKFASHFQKDYGMEREKSQKLTLIIEDKINHFFPNLNDYTNSIKDLIKVMKARKIDLEQLTQIEHMEKSNFVFMIKQNLLTLVNNTVDSPENDASPRPEKKAENTHNENHHSTSIRSQ